jgi:hypothetical protein
MPGAIRCAALLAVVVLATACGGRSPTAPTMPPVASTPPPAPSPEFPAITRPASVYNFADAPFLPADWTRRSRFVLYDDGRFSLQYAGLGEYPGTYTVASTRIQFAFDGWSTAGSLGATATLVDDRLSVQFNMVMLMSDFEDAVYVRMK